MRRVECAAALAGTAAILLSALWTEAAAAGATAGGRLPTAGKGLLMAARFSCPHLTTPRCARGYRAECTRWTYAGPKGSNMAKCCGRLGCVPFPTNPQTREPPRLPKPLPGTRVR
jgi:hypothetical protein